MLSKFDYVRPQALEEAIIYLEQNQATKILAGGTDLMIMLRRNGTTVKHILDIKSLEEIKRLEYNQQQGLLIGAAITVNEIAETQLIQEKYPALAQAAQSLASYQVRNRATVVGNICNASPGADLAGPLLVYDAQVQIAHSQKRYTVDLHKFFRGVKQTILQPNEIVLGVTLPPIDSGEGSIYLKQARIKGHDLGIVGVAARLTVQKELRLAMSAVAPTPIRLFALEKLLNAQPFTREQAVWAEQGVRKFIKPISDVRSSAEYRLHIAGVLVKRALLQLLDLGGEQHG